MRWVGAHPRLVAFLAACVITLARCQERFARPGVWAEDGVVFLEHLLHGNGAGILTPLFGHYHAIGRFVAWVMFEAFPLEHFSFGVTFCWCILFSLVLSTFAAPAYREYVPSDAVRILAVVALCVAPGLPEMYGNLANLHTAFYVYIWLLAVRPPGQSISVPEFLFGVICVFSSGATVVVAPVLAFRLYNRWRAGQSVGREGVLLAALVLLVGMNLTQVSEHLEGEPPGVGEAAWRLVTYSARSAVVDPWWGVIRGFGLSTLLSNTDWRNLSIIALLVMVYRLARQGTLGHTLLLGYGVATAVPLLTWFVRPGSIAMFESSHPSNAWMRYGFQLAPFALVLWLFLMRAESAQRGRSYFHVAVLFLVVYTATWGDPFRLDSYDPAGWPEQARKLDRARAECRETLIVPIAPQGWELTYEAARDADCSSR